MSDFLIAYSKLVALKSNLPKSGYGIEQYYIDQYHQSLDSLKNSLGDGIDEFRVEQSEIRPVMVSGNYRTGEKQYSSKSYCDREKLLIKLDGLLNYLILQSSGEEQKKIIGFQAQTGED